MPRCFEEFALAPLEFGVVEGLDDAALAEQVVPVGHGGRELDVLLDEQHAGAGGLDLADDRPDPGHDHRGQALGGLVHEQQTGTGPQHPGDGQHLLLPARQRGARRLAALGEHGERLVDPLQRPGPVGDLGREEQVLLHREAGVDAAVVLDPAHAGAGPLVRRHAGDVAAEEGHGAADLPVQADQAPHQGGLAGAVAAGQRDDLALADAYVHPVQRLRLAVPRLQTGDLKHGRPRPGRR